MDGVEQARAYADADFSEPHDRFVALFRARFPDAVPRRVLDLGCGPCDVTRRFARGHPGCAITALDGSRAMLDEARRRNRDAGFADRIELVETRLPSAALAGRTFDTVLSNSLLHHLPDPAILWTAVRGALDDGGIAYVMDLSRPRDEAVAERLVQLHAADAPDVLRHDFHASLLAAYRPDEVVRQLAAAGLGSFRVEVVSDRHWIAYGRGARA